MATETDAGDPAPSAASADSAVGTTTQPASAQPATKGWVRRQLTLTLPGSVGALAFAGLSFTPSLLPRGGLLQGLIAGIDAAIGYGLGVLAAAIWRAFADRDQRPARRSSWRFFFFVGGAALICLYALGQYWQHLIRDLMGVTEYNVLYVVLSPIVAVVTFAVFLLIGRGVRALYRWAAALLDRWIGRRAARTVGWLLVAGLTYGVVSGVLLDGLVSAANEAFSVRNGDTDSGAKQPTTDLRSGGPGSLVSWDSLGREGRKFTGLGPTTADISSFSHHPAVEPIRVYAGLESADSTEQRAKLAVDDLVRAGGFQRKYLLIVTATGSGWVDPALSDSFEYLGGGDSAIVSMQYSYLPSWLSFLVDQSKARAAGRELFDAVYEKWSALPETSRPRLFVAGESLGSFGGEEAFSGEYDMRNRASGILFAGPPNFNTLFRQFKDDRDAGTPEIEPVYKAGRTVRFTTDPIASIPPPSQAWNGGRVLYLMHASDPIVWWSPNLVLDKPDWIGQQPGSDVLGQMFWMPFVTFWQVTGDLAFSTGVPAGHGHRYKAEYVDGWNAVMQPPGVTPDDLASLRSVMPK